MLEIGFGAGEALLAFAQPSIRRSTALASKCIAPASVTCCWARKRPDSGICASSVTMQSKCCSVQLPARSISLAHIFFPDPWPKKRHHKRRLIQPPFIELLARVIDQDGVLRLATDWEPYALQMREVLEASSSFENVAGDSGFVARINRQTAHALRATRSSPWVMVCGIWRIDDVRADRRMTAQRTRVEIDRLR